MVKTYSLTVWQLSNLQNTKIITTSNYQMCIRHLLNGFESQIISLELISQTGRLGGKLLSDKPNTVGELKMKRISNYSMSKIILPLTNQSLPWE